MTEFDKPHDFAYNADLQTLSKAIIQLIGAVNTLEERIEALSKPKRAGRPAKDKTAK